MSEDNDPAETAEWREALRALAASAGPGRARYILDALAEIGRDPTIGWQPPRGTPYLNTIHVDRQPAFPGDLAIEERLASLMRWNALAMVVRANNAHGELRGHIATYASALFGCASTNPRGVGSSRIEMRPSRSSFFAASRTVFR